jgi:hypothetical protein
VISGLSGGLQAAAFPENYSGAPPTDNQARGVWAGGAGPPGNLKVGYLLGRMMWPGQGTEHRGHRLDAAASALPIAAAPGYDLGACDARVRTSASA